MASFDILNIAHSGMMAQSARLNTIASNLANVESVTSPNGTPYQPKQVVFQSVLTDKMGVEKVAVRQIVDDYKPPLLVYDPQNPVADENGYVAKPNINPVEEMTNMISASKSYQFNVEVFNTGKQLMLRTLKLGE